jgi:hypothetical protein
MPDQEQQPMPSSVFVLGPALDNVIEPVPATVPDAVAPGRRQIAFDTPPTSPGGRVNLTILPPVHPDDKIPLNVYAFFVQPVESVPAPADRTPDWFFKSGSPHGFAPVSGGAVGPDGRFVVAAPGVQPSLQPYFVQTILEFVRG